MQSQKSEMSKELPTIWVNTGGAHGGNSHTVPTSNISETIMGCPQFKQLLTEGYLI